MANLVNAQRRRQVNYDLESDITADSEIVAKVKQSKSYAQNLYAAMCNMRWQKSEVIPILKEDLWSCTWRYAGGIVADLRGEGDYLNWYCSGMSGGVDLDDEQINKGYVPESVVTEEIAKDLKRLGWYPVEWDSDKIGEY